MNVTSYTEEIEVAVAAVREAAQLCQAVQTEISPDVLEKKDRSPVTVADFGSQALVCRVLREALPDDPIMAEEDSAALQTPENKALLQQVVERIQQIHLDADMTVACSWIDAGNLAEQRDRFWTLDPIDGTKGFLRKDQYAIALALIVDGEVQVAALACPNLPPRLDGPDLPGGVYAAVRGEGCWMLPLEGNRPAAPVQVSTLETVSAARLCESFISAHSSHSDAEAVAERLGITAEPLRLDSQAKYAIVARGEADIYLRLPTGVGYVEKIWDHAAGMLVIEEAGGRATDIHGKPLQFHFGRTLQQNEGVVVTNGHLHDNVLEALAIVGVA